MSSHRDGELRTATASSLLIEEQQVGQDTTRSNGRRAEMKQRGRSGSLLVLHAVVYPEKLCKWATLVRSHHAPLYHPYRYFDKSQHSDPELNAGKRNNTKYDAALHEKFSASPTSETSGPKDSPSHLIRWGFRTDLGVGYTGSNTDMEPRTQPPSINNNYNTM
ncbi:hypothetical protein SODALDRAFT_357459 [Sodiomyces alkalinus F11]|uniref:Uncharacterized protein n=1 Tax=Sodiomyces alkalinus (strain CBS 110278 / VKM F-3762 / F11) TaxID=1314773 RepID=A0A3N2Q3U0_SODAK|nr:hypothetical protein SODALDRAFT_357459 [Sodiomyces alkalinus F11]ROT41420.1 hypothetical protein SODALDRAFT_357459 [Sodiomyces alkalinus F11]